MVPTSHCGPPRGTKRKHQARRRYEAGEDRSASGLVGRLPSRVEGFVYTSFCFLLGDPGALRHKLRKISAVRSRQ